MSYLPALNPFTVSGATAPRGPKIFPGRRLSWSCIDSSKYSFHQYMPSPSTPVDYHKFGSSIRESYLSSTTTFTHRILLPLSLDRHSSFLFLVPHTVTLPWGTTFPGQTRPMPMLTAILGHRHNLELRMTI